MRVIGVDVGGTTIKALPVEIGGLEAAESSVFTEPSVQVLAPVERRPTPANDPEAVLGTITELVGSLRRTTDAEAVGIAVPGIIDEPRGVAVMAANVGWSDTPVADLIGTATGLPVALGHDVRAGGLAEWRLGAGRGATNLLLVMLGTGIGSAIVTDGRLLTALGYAGQLGHTVVEPDGPACTCGQRGCLGAIASAASVVRQYGVEGVTEAREVAARARAGDEAALAVWDRAVEALSVSLTTAVTLLGPEVVVLGGGLSLAGDQLVVPVSERLRARLTFQRPPRVVAAGLGDESGILGAALLAGQKLSAVRPTPAAGPR